MELKDEAGGREGGRGTRGRKEPRGNGPFYRSEERKARKAFASMGRLALSRYRKLACGLIKLLRDITRRVQMEG